MSIFLCEMLVLYVLFLVFYVLFLFQEQCVDKRSGRALPPAWAISLIYFNLFLLLN